MSAVESLSLAYLRGYAKVIGVHLPARMKKSEVLTTLRQNDPNFDKNLIRYMRKQQKAPVATDPTPPPTPEPTKATPEPTPTKPEPELEPVTTMTKKPLRIKKKNIQKPTDGR